MKFKANLITCESGVLLFDIEGLTPDLEIDKPYTLEVKPYKSNRSLEQNRKLWLHIQQLAEVTGNDIMDIYISALENADCKSDYLLVMPETIEGLKKVFRAVKVVEYREHEKDGKTITMAVVKCWHGSSKHNTLEFTRLVNYILDLCVQNGIEVDL